MCANFFCTSYSNCMKVRTYVPKSEYELWTLVLISSVTTTLRSQVCAFEGSKTELSSYYYYQFLHQIKLKLLPINICINLPLFNAIYVSTLRSNSKKIGWGIWVWVEAFGEIHPKNVLDGQFNYQFNFYKDHCFFNPGNTRVYL